MLADLRLNNYQIWSSLDLKFGRFTLITGPSGYGKSSIIRALQSVLSGVVLPAHRKQSTDFTSLDLGIGGFRLIRFRSDSVNRVVLKPPNGSPVTFDRIGRAYPSDLLQSLNLPILDLGDGRVFLYLHYQFDRPFLLADSPSRVSAIISTCLGFDRLASAQKRISSDARSVTNQLSSLESERSRINLESLRHYLNSKRADYEFLLKARGLRLSLASEVGKIEATLSEIETLPTLVSLPEIEVSVLIHRADLVTEIETLSRILEDSTSLNDLSEIPSFPEEVLLHRLTLTKEIAGLVSVLSSFASLPDLESFLEERASLLSELQSIPLCDTCGRPL